MVFKETGYCPMLPSGVKGTGRLKKVRERGQSTVRGSCGSKSHEEDRRKDCRLEDRWEADTGQGLTKVPMLSLKEGAVLSQEEPGHSDTVTMFLTSTRCFDHL